MGYRHYFYLVEKEQVEKAKKMTYDELSCYAREQGWIDEDDCFFFCDAFNQKEIFEFGKLYFDDTAERIYSSGVPMFENEETQKEFSDYVPYIVGKNGVKTAIDIYKEKVLNYFRSLVTPECAKQKLVNFRVKPEDLDIGRVCDAVEEKILRWSNFCGTCPVNIEEKREEITNSFLFEYHIFELVRIYKYTDWEKYTVLFYGW